MAIPIALVVVHNLGGVVYAIINFLVEKRKVIQNNLLFVTASDLTAGAVLISLV
jgi:hypothetical protein